MFEVLKDYYIHNNLKLIPIKPNGKEPLINWKMNYETSTDQVFEWLLEEPNLNWALPMNANDLFAIDIDMHGDVNGIENFKRLCKDLGIESIKTLVQKTPSGGYHLIFKSDEDLKKVKNSANTFNNYKGIDIRTDGYILVYPSKINDVFYEYKTDNKDIMPQIATMPSKLKEFILNSNVEYVEKTNTQRKTCDFYREGKVIDKGNRDTEMFMYITTLYNDTNLSYDEIRVLAYTYNERCFNPPLTTSVIDYKLRNCFKKDRDQIIILRINKQEEGENKYE
jgi:uncharacterized protein YuzE